MPARKTALRAALVGFVDKSLINDVNLVRREPKWVNSAPQEAKGVIVEEDRAKVTLTVTVSPTLARFLCVLVEQDDPGFWTDMALVITTGKETLDQELKRIESGSLRLHGAEPTKAELACRIEQTLAELSVLEALAYRLSCAGH